MNLKNPASGFKAWFENPSISDPIDRRMAVLIQVLLFGILAVVLLAFFLNLALSPAGIPWQANLLRTLIFITILSIPLIVLRRGYLRTSAKIIIAIFLLLEIFAVGTTDLRDVAETLTFFTLAIILAGLLLSRRTLLLVFLISAAAVLVSAYGEQAPTVREDSFVIAANFILLNGLIGLFIDHFGITLRRALQGSLEREDELETEVGIRRQAEAALEQFAARLEIIHEIDRSLLSARSLNDIAQSALARIRLLVPSPRASITLFDLLKKEAFFLAADFEGAENISMTPITLEEYGQRIVDDLLQNKPWFVNDVLQDPHATELDRRIAEQNGIYSWLSLPLHNQGQLIGALNLGRGPGQTFSAEEAEIAHDVANQLAIALQQTHLNNALQNELAERKKLIAQLEAINAELERFTYTVSHDLRNPLVTIKGFLGMLEKDIREGKQERIKEDLNRISNAADRMHVLLADLLELSRVGRIMNPPENVDLGEVVREAIETLDAQLRARNVTVHCPLDFPIVYGDRIRLREVFENLIDNAAKYAGNQTDPMVEIDTRTDGSETVIYVKDNGIGIEPQYQGKIFGLFDKLNPTSEGTGIGLALVKRIIETHGGNIWVESDGRGKGSTFCFTLPNGKTEDDLLQA
jgi:signal transduction histidine kinase